MDDYLKAENLPPERQPLNTALAQMPEAEVVRLLDVIESLQGDLLRLIPLFDGREPAEAVAHTQDLLNILSAEIRQFLALKEAKVARDHSSNPDKKGASVDYAPVHRMLSKYYRSKRRLVWSDA